MLTENDVAMLCLRLNLAPQAQAVLSTIQSSPPSRRVGSGGKNVPVTYTSRKMGVTIQAESYKNELVVGVLHTPDYFVIRADALGWEEWKMEEDLVRLAEKMPHRYVRGEDGTWHCPPGEQVAAPLGFYYRVRSSCDIHWVFQRNLRFLSYYLRTDTPSVKEAAKKETIALTTSHPGITLAELLKRRDRATSDDIYTLLATEQLYVDVYAAPLAELERVHIFCDEQTARAWATALAQDASSDMSHPHTLLIEPGASVVWDGKPCTILYQGQTTTTLLTEDRRPLEVSNSHFQALAAQGKLVGQASPPERGSLGVQVRARISFGSPFQVRHRAQRRCSQTLESKSIPCTTGPEAMPSVIPR